MHLYSSEGRPLARNVPVIDDLSARYLAYRQKRRERAKAEAIETGVREEFFDIRSHNRSVSWLRGAWLIKERRRRERLAGETRGFESFRRTGYMLDLHKTIPVAGLAKEIHAFYLEDCTSETFQRVLSERPVRVPVRYATNPGLTRSILEFICHPETRKVICGYFGFLPVLNDISIWYSTANETLKGMQKLHIHPIGGAELRFFLNVTDVKPENGPTSFIPKDKTAEIYRQRNATHIMDSKIDKADLVTLAGPAGSLSVVDTANCYHFGGRTREGERVIMMVKFSAPWDLNVDYLSTISYAPESVEAARDVLGGQGLL